MFSVGNVAMTAYNADNLGVKAIAKRAAKDTGKAVLHDLNDNKQKNRPQAGATHNGAGVDSEQKTKEKAPR